MLTLSLNCSNALAAGLLATLTPAGGRGTSPSPQTPLPLWCYSQATALVAIHGNSATGSEQKEVIVAGQLRCDRTMEAGHSVALAIDRLGDIFIQASTAIATTEDLTECRRTGRPAPRYTGRPARRGRISYDSGRDQIRRLSEMFIPVKKLTTRSTPALALRSAVQPTKGVGPQR